MDRAISVSTRAGNQSARGASPAAEAIRVIEWATVNEGDDEGELAELAERRHQADQEQQMVDAAEDVLEAHGDEVQPGLRPVRVEPDAPRVRRLAEAPARRRRATRSGSRSGRAGRGGRSGGRWRVGGCAAAGAASSGASSSTSSRACRHTSCVVAGSGGPRTCARARSKSVNERVGRDRQPGRADGRGRQLVVAGVEVEVGCDPAIGGRRQEAARSDIFEVEDAPGRRPETASPASPPVVCARGPGADRPGAGRAPER